MPKSKDIFHLENPSSSSQSSEVAAAEGCKSSGGITGYLVVGVIVIVILIGAFMLYKYCSNDTLEDSVEGAVEDQRHGDGTGHSSPGALVEIESPTQWQGLMNSEGPFVVAFTMTGCGHCTTMKPALQSAGRTSKVGIYQLNFNGEDWKQAEVSKLKIQGFPTMYRFDQGTAHEHKGGRDEGSIVRFAETGQ